MIAATYTQGGVFAIEEVPVPLIGDNEVLLRIHATSICGTDVKIIRHGHRKLRSGQKITLGHEFAGVIEKAGRNVKDLAEGLRVGVAPNWGCGYCPACQRGLANYCPNYSAFGIDNNGAHAAFTRIPEAAIRQGNVMVLPDELPWEAATLAEPLSCVVNAQRDLRLSSSDSIAVYGCGPMGLLHVLLAASSKAKEIIAIDPHKSRLERASGAGATHALVGRQKDLHELLMHITEGRGLDVVITAAPSPEIAREAVSLLAPFGRLCLFAGLPKDRAEIALDGNSIHYRNLQITGTSGGSNRDYAEALELLRSGRVRVDGIVSHRFPMSEVAAAYETAQAGVGTKIILTTSA